MAAVVDLDLLLHHTIRLLMREEGKSADQAFDAAVPLLLGLLAEDIDPVELDLYRKLLPELRESILPEYRKPQPDLSDLSPLIQQRSEAVAQHQRQRRRRRQLGGRP